MTTAQRIPGGKSTVTPYVVVKGADRFLEFVERTFEVTTSGRFLNQDGTVGHAEITVGESVLMALDAAPEWPETPSFLSVYVDDVERVGNIWWLQTHVEDVDEATARERFTDPKELETMRIAQETFAQEMRRRVTS